MPTPGHPVTVRLNPTDELGVLDVLQYVGVQTVNLSWAQCVKIAMGSMLEGMRASGLIPRPDGFDYEQRVILPYFAHETHKSRGQKIKFTEDWKHRESMSEGRWAPPVARSNDGEQRRKQRYEELSAKESDPSQPMTEKELSELHHLFKEFGDGNR